jgi:flagellar motor switch/type III secretory pathway protein FliN
LESTPKFSAYPWERLRKLSRRDAQLVSAIARWLPGAELVNAWDPNGASCELRVGGESIDVRGAAARVRQLAQELLGGPAELEAPRPLGVVEHALWALAVARVAKEHAIDGEVWPRVEPLPAPPDAVAVELAPGVVALVPRGLELRLPPSKFPTWAASWTIDAPVVLGRCVVAEAQVGRLAVRDLVTVERCCQLDLFGGTVGLRAAPNALVAEVVSGYVPREMSLPDDAAVELTVGLGTTRLTLRQVLDLAVGQVVQLHRPLAGPFEVHAAGRLVGRGELVDVDGELAVRIVSLEA